jgi:hypothetical protein
MFKPAPSASAGQPEPEHIHRRAELDRGHEAVADHGPAAIGGHRERRPHLHGAVRPRCQYPGDPVSVADQVRHLSRTQQREALVPGRLLGEQIQQVPLRKEGQVRVADRQAGEVGEGKGLIADGHSKGVDRPVGDRAQPIAQCQLVHQVQCGGMHGVTTKITQEVAGPMTVTRTPPRTSRAEHQASGTAATTDTSVVVTGIRGVGGPTEGRC